MRHAERAIRSVEALLRGSGLVLDDAPEHLEGIELEVLVYV